MDSTQVKEAHAFTLSLSIGAPPARVWSALTDPEQIRQYLFETRTYTDWQIGHPIEFRGMWQGQEYLDKGSILEFIPERILSYSYWSSLSGEPDEPASYRTIRFELMGEDGSTRLILTQGNNPSDASAEHSRENWQGVLDCLKRLIEFPPQK